MKYTTIDNVEYATPEQAGQMLGYKTAYIYLLVNQGKMKYQKVLGVNKYFSLDYLKTCKRNTRVKK